MARKLRIHYPGAIYHVINRGNYRKDVFASAGAAEAFERVLAETTALYGWRIHAWVIMRNHFHLALETPEPNLAQGMHWLLSTLATRFNRFRKERGHLFQGRYQALLIENHESLRRVVDYIHLNPVRAGIVEPEKVVDFSWSSLRKFVKNEGFPGMVAGDRPPQQGDDPTRQDWRGHLEWLAELARDEARQKKLGFDTFCQGWGIGTSGWRKAVAKEFAAKALSPGLEAREIRALREAVWENSVEEALRECQRDEAGLLAAGKTAAWKIELALRVRQRCGAGIAWLAHRLHLGTPDTARCQLSLAKRTTDLGK